VFIGDSFTEGQGVDEPRTFPRLVERLLGADEAELPVWNLGIRGHDFPELADLMAPALARRPRVVVLSMILNDAERGPELAAAWPRLNDAIMIREDATPPAYDWSRLLSFAHTRLLRLRRSHETISWYRALYADGNRAGWARTRARLMEMKRAAEGAGARFGVALWPLMVGLGPGEEYPFAAAHDQIRRGVERTRIPFLDLLPELRGRASQDYWVHPSDLHPNEVAHAKVAPALAKFALDLRPRPSS
jgi:lysophospholipase L1-like esterase